MAMSRRRQRTLSHEIISAIRCGYELSEAIVEAIQCGYTKHLNGVCGKLLYGN